MNFTDAVRELAEGRCKEIEKDGIFIRLYNDCLRCAFTSGGEISTTFFLEPEFYLGDDFELVGEKPQMEEVELFTYRCPTCTHMQDKPVMCCGDAMVRLTGHYQRPVPRKVKRREELDKRSHNSCWYIREDGYTVKVPTDRPVYVEWEEEAPK